MLVIPIGDVNPVTRIPWVTWSLIMLNIAIYLAFNFAPEYDDIVDGWGYTPNKGSVVTMFTSMFLHGGLLHLFGNMLFLYIFGDNVEEQLGPIGFLALYLSCGFFAAFAHGRMIPKELMDLPCVGGSGAIAGMLGAYIILYPKARLKVWYWFLIKIGTFMMAAVWCIGFWFLKELFTHISSGGLTSVAHGAHIGGFILGLIVIGILGLTGVVHPEWRK